jgi:tetratricopeptide (TPR) repeat protein
MPLKLLPFVLACLLLASCGNGGETPAADSVKSDSITNINELIRKDPGNLDLYVRRARIAMNRKEYPAALADMNRVIAIDSSNSDYLVAAADINFFVGNVKRTEQLLKRSVEMNPDDSEGVLRLAQLYHYLTKYEEEIVLLNRVLEKDPRNAQAYYMKGVMYKEAKDTAKAISNLQQAVEKDPDHYNAYIQLGLLAAMQKNPLAEQYYLNAINISPNSEEAIYNLGIYYQENEKYDRAIETYTTLLKINPRHFDAHFNIATIDTRWLKKYDEALTHFSQAIEIDPKNARGYFGRGVCYKKMGNLKNAEADFRTALQMDPTYTAAAQAIEDINVKEED